MTKPILFVPLDIKKLSDMKIGYYLMQLGKNFPVSGNNYAEQILREAIRRLRAFEKQCNR